MPQPPRLLRASELARFWGLHSRTVLSWIRDGRLAAIRSPGNHFRLRPADVLAFCEREGWPVPPFVAPPLRRAVLAGAAEPLARSVARALRTAVTLDAFADPYDGVVAAARSPTAVVALSAAFPRFDAAAAVRALCAGAGAAGTRLVVFDVSSRAQAAAAHRAGAARSIARSREQDLPGVLRELLGLEPV